MLGLLEVEKVLLSRDALKASWEPVSSQLSVECEVSQVSSKCHHALVVIRDVGIIWVPNDLVEGGLLVDGRHAQNQEGFTENARHELHQHNQYTPVSWLLSVTVVLRYWILEIPQKVKTTLQIGIDAQVHK